MIAAKIAKGIDIISQTFKPSKLGPPAKSRILKEVETKRLHAESNLA